MKLLQKRGKEHVSCKQVAVAGYALPIAKMTQHSNATLQQCKEAKMQHIAIIGLLLGCDKRPHNISTSPEPAKTGSHTRTYSGLCMPDTC